MKLILKHIDIRGLSLIVLLVLGICSYAQKNPQLEITNYQLFFNQPQEEIFLDLPKNIFFMGEPVRFAGYVFDKIKKLPSSETVNVYVCIYDESGTPITEQLFYTDKGKFYGEIRIPKEKSAGKYFVKAYTNWMRNFPEEFMYMQDIYLIDETQQKESTIAAESSTILFYPEGGNLISEVRNSVGFRVNINNGNSFAYDECLLMDSQGNTIVENIRINPQGYGKFEFIPNDLQNYSLKILLENKDAMEASLPSSKNNGLALQINSGISENISLQINCQYEELQQYKNRPITIAIHRNGQLKLINYRLKESETIVSLSKQEVLPGLNKLSIFDDDQNILAERIFFNDIHIDQFKDKTNLEVVNHDLDSISISMSLDQLQEGSTAQLSMSVLPNETEARNYQDNLASWLLLESYFENTIDTKNFFPNITRKHLYDLDLFLISNQWNRYQWKDPMTLTPEYEHSFDKGISINGKLTGDSKLKNKKLTLYQKSIGEYFTTRINSELGFSINDVYIVKDEPIFFFAEGSKLSRYTKVNLSYFPETDSKPLTKKELERFLRKDKINIKKSFNTTLVQFPEAEQLDEIVLNAELKPKLTRNPRLQVGVMNSEKISEKEAGTQRLSTYLEKKGFRILRINGGNLGNPFYVLPTKNAIDTRGPTFYLNGFPTRLDPVDDMPLTKVDELYYHHFSGGTSDSGEIYVYTRTERTSGDVSSKLLQAVAKVGFNTQSSQGLLKLDDFIKKYFIFYGNVYWNPNIEVTSGNTIELKFPSYSLKEFKVFVNGFSDKGEIISTSKYIAVD